MTTLEQRARSLAQYAASCCQWPHDGTPMHYTDRCEAKILEGLKVVEREALERALTARIAPNEVTEKYKGTPDWPAFVMGVADKCAAIRALIDTPASEPPDPRDAASELSELLAEALNLCVRARKIDSVIPRPGDDPLMTRSATTALWVQDQYDTDLASWETRARKALS